MSVLVTGGLGFIGSNLCHRLAESGEQVRILDNMSTNAIEGIENTDLINDTCLNRKSVSRALQGVSAVLQLFSVPGIETCEKEPGVYRT